MQAQFEAIKQREYQDTIARHTAQAEQMEQMRSPMNRPMQESQGPAFARSQQESYQNSANNFAQQAAQQAKVTQLRDAYAAQPRQGPVGLPSLATRAESQNPNTQFNAASANQSAQMNRPSVGAGSNMFQRAPAFKKGGKVSAAPVKLATKKAAPATSSRADGIATKGKTRGKMC